MLAGLMLCILGPIFWFMIAFTAFEGGSTGRFVCILLAIGSIIFGIVRIVSSLNMAVTPI